MADLQAEISFPGLKDIFDASFTFSTGITPSACNITLNPQKEVDLNPGTLKIQFGGIKLEWPDAIIDTSFLEIGPGGFIGTVRVIDRRWKWKWGTTGHGFLTRSNIRLPNGEILAGMQDIDADTKRSPRKIAKDLYEWMGEPKPTDDQVKALPEAEPFPEFEFIESNPAKALADLCDMFGCRVVLKLDNKVWICKVGEGKELPDGGKAINAGFSLKHNMRPDEIRIVGGPTRFEAKFKLEPYGRDVSGVTKPIDDLSYMPPKAIGVELGIESFGDAGGWLSCDPVTMGDVTKCYRKSLADKGGADVPLVEESTLEEFDDITLVGYAHCRDLARETVWRWFRIKELAEGGVNIRDMSILDGGTVFKFDPIENFLVDLTVDANGVKQPVPAFVEGEFCDNSIGENTIPFTRYRGSFSIVKEYRGGCLVVFSEPVYREDESGLTLPPVLYLTASFSSRDDFASSGYHRFESLRDMPGKKLKTGPYVVRHDEIVLTHKVVYTGKTPVAVKTNKEECEKQAEHYLDALEKQFTPEPASDVSYAGIMGKDQLDLDGAIQQISYSLGKSQPATTRASRNAEHSDFIPTFFERRRREKAKDAELIAGVAPDVIRKMVLGAR